MDCLKEKCQYYSVAESKNHGIDFCTITLTFIHECPIDRMIRYCEDRLEGLISIRKYLGRLKQC